jgi:V8-like Glu-specific endopeptidase
MNRLLAAWILVFVAANAHADEGMWTFNAFPSQDVQRKYGFAPSQEWLDHLRLSSVRLAGGCSGSVVSPSGLVMTNHHCVHACIEQVSTAARDYVANGFVAGSEADEIRCPKIELNQLRSITDVTARVTKATAGLSGGDFVTAQRGVISQIEKECAQSALQRCDVISLYNGGRYDLYQYRRYQDVRLVFAPEHKSASFGGDPDNFNFPRFSFDVAFLRIWEGGKPEKTEHHLRWSEAGAKEGELTFISGHPGGTNRLMTVAELQYMRDVLVPAKLLRLAELRGMLMEFQRRGPEQHRIATSKLAGVANSLKGMKGRHRALLDPDFMASKVKAERALLETYRKDTPEHRQLEQAYREADAAIAELRRLHRPLVFLEMDVRKPRRPTLQEEGVGGFDSELFKIARHLVRAADELPRPDGERLREYGDGYLPFLKQQLFSAAPIHPELEIALLTFSLTKLREELGTDHPVVKRVLGKLSPRDLATQAVKGTKLGNVARRHELFEGGKAALEKAAKDPMIAMALAVDAEGRSLRQEYETKVESVLSRAGEQLARARFAGAGASAAPDATFSLRLTYGQVKGFQEGSTQVPPFTTFSGLFERHTGSFPYALTPGWLSARTKLRQDTPMNFATSNDIIGGNSGSPTLNQRGEVVGIVFDGNIHSLGGDYWFDETRNRAISVHSEAILEGLGKVYRARRLVQELRPVPGSGGG